MMMTSQMTMQLKISKTLKIKTTSKTEISLNMMMKAKKIKT